ncbi:MAG TPA: MBL fold metallo-hydrolase [Jiangellaceae bacterium]|nr:MBL fold metallo-hydrolase [Jiangellaceae bacterium]
MRLTKYEHACVLVEDEGVHILIDPGVYSSGFEALTGLDAVLITHQHADHVDRDRLGPLLANNPEARVYADDATAAILREKGIEAAAATEGERISVGVDVSVHGVNHALIHPDIPIIPNVGYLVSGRFFHPGDAFTIPDVPVDVLGLPTGAPWLKASEAVDYLRAVAPRVAVPIHEAGLVRPAMHYALFDQLALSGTSVRVVEPGTTIDV